MPADSGRSDSIQQRIDTLRKAVDCYIPKKGKEGKVYGEAIYKTLLRGCRFWLKGMVDALLITNKARDDVD